MEEGTWGDGRKFKSKIAKVISLYMGGDRATPEGSLDAGGRLAKVDVTVSSTTLEALGPQLRAQGFTLI